MRRLFFGLIFTALFAIIIACLPVKKLQETRNDIAYSFVEKKQNKLARILYRVNAWQGDVIAINNYHVLNYRSARYRKNSSKAKVETANQKAKAAFDKLIAKGYAPAAYNRGMFYYNASTKNRHYAKTLSYFEQGAALGDPLSRDAADFMRAKKFKGEAYYEAIRPIAERGNGWAAYRYVRSMRRDHHKLSNRGEPYAVIGAESGIADAQRFLAEKFPNRLDAAQWLEKAATHPVNPSSHAANDLAELALRYGDEEARRKWLKVATKPREKFQFSMIIAPEGLRWRDFQKSRSRDVNHAESAAYELALMQLAGIGGPTKKRAAIKNLKLAKDWSGAQNILAQIKSGDLKTVKAEIKTDFAKKTSGLASGKPDYGLLNIYIERGDLRLATDQDLQTFKSATTMRSAYKGSYSETNFNLMSNCKNFTCYYIEKPLTLPEGMVGAYASAFLINPKIDLPKQLKSHNIYAFLKQP